MSSSVSSTLPDDYGKTYVDRPEFREEKILRAIFEKAKQDDPQSILDTFEWFVHNVQGMMNVGKMKGAKVVEVVKELKPIIACELGAYCGYSAVLIGSVLPENGHLYSFEFDPLHAAIATKVVDYAGLSKKVTVIVGTVPTKIQELKNRYGVTSVDFLFIDHVKEAYTRDHQIFEASGLLHKGSTVIADNIIRPGAPEYAEYIRARSNYRSELFKVELKRGDEEWVDGIEISVRTV